MDRRFGSQPDARVPLEPDTWQQNVLNSIDANGSVLVITPISAGRTFISFYTMKKVLEEVDDEVLVYVVPAKALVDQIAAEVEARFSKTYRNPHELKDRLTMSQAQKAYDVHMIVHEVCYSDLRNGRSRKENSSGVSQPKTVEEKLSKFELAHEEASLEINAWENFDPEAPFEHFSFAETETCSAGFSRLVRSSSNDKVAPWLVDALRYSVKMRFCRGYVRLVVATGTLARGINMPSSSGRAGQRGFDLLGNVVFNRLSQDWVHEISTIPTVTRSPFAALSSFTDNFQSIEDLGPVQEGVFIEESSIPYIPILPHDNDTKFNAHLYDSCKHGSWEVLRVIGAKDDLDLDNPEEKDSDADVPEVSSGGIEVQKPMETLENIIKTVVKGKGKFKVADS
ncbi:hypothetical protein LZL87_007458 [Fusarium oxysporum]|nr:hypothetical protein LZL87_007458 [Fusarium oxysporum]